MGCSRLMLGSVTEAWWRRPACKWDLRAGLVENIVERLNGV